MRNIIPLFMLALLSLGFVAQAHTITIDFWNDLTMTSKYQNNFMKVYFLNKSYAGGYDYTFKCYHGDYINGSATIIVNDTDYYDLLITDGNLQWSNTTGCPTMVENYDFWATVQSNMLINKNQHLDYFINVTLEGEPRSYFWSTQSWRSIFSALYWLAVVAFIIFLEWWMMKNGGQPSWILPVIIFIVAILLKLGLGI